MNLTNSNLLVGLCGNAGSGKDTFAETFHFFGFRQYSFAGPVKACASVALGIPLNYFTDRHLKEEVHPFWNISPRVGAQWIGTELFRERFAELMKELTGDDFGTDFWIKRLELQLISDYARKEEVKAVISDVRFQNEAQWILDSGGVLVHLTRPGYVGNVGIPGHASEAGIQFGQLVTTGRKTRIFAVANDGTLQQLEEKAVALAESFDCKVAQ